MSAVLDFTPSEPLTLGVELELQVVNAYGLDLINSGGDLLRLLADGPAAARAKSEITGSMIEIDTSVHRRHGPLLAELEAVRDAVCAAADRLNLRICGGGTHPYHHWGDQRIVDEPRYRMLRERYGYLAKTFTVFGQHVHVGCPDGDVAMRVTRALARYVPHFIALAAASPFQQGEDTRFACARLSAIAPFPLSGTMPPIGSWDEFISHFQQLERAGIVASIKDFYWDIRPKPEYGTIEIRVFDSPLSVARAAALAAYAQALAARIQHDAAALESLPEAVYRYNRFEACRYGLDATLHGLAAADRRTLREDLLETLGSLAVEARALDSEEVLAGLAELARSGRTDAALLRDARAARGSLEDVVRFAFRRWRGVA